MQRRAAAVSAAILLLLAVGAYGLLGVAEEPAIETETTAELSVNQTVTLGDTEYRVASLSGTAGGTAEFQWFNESSRYTATLANNSTISPAQDLARTDWNDTTVTYHLLVEAGEEPTSFTLTEVQNVSAPTYTDNGTTYVVVDQDGDGTNETISREEYLPEPREVTYSVGDTYEYENNSTTIASLSPSEVTLEWFGPRTLSRSVSNGNNVTLNDESYLAYFQDTDPSAAGPEQVILTQDQAGYEASLDRQDYWSERMRGLWGVVVLGLLGGMGLIGLAYLPSRY